MTHEQFSELLPLYVIGALDGEELHELERYIAANRERTAPEIAEFQAVADQLVFAAPPAEPSAEVFERVMAEIDEREQPAMSATERHEGVDWNALFLNWAPWAVTAAAAVFLVIMTIQWRHVTQQYREQLTENARQRDSLAEQGERISGLSSNFELQARQFKTETDQLRAANSSLQHDVDGLKIANAKLTEEKTDLMRAAAEMEEKISKRDLEVAVLGRTVEEQNQRLGLFMDPGARVAQLHDPKQQTKATARVYWRDVNKTGLLVASNLPPVAKEQGKCLELWAICGSAAPVPAGLFWTDNTGHGVLEIKLAKELACVDKFAVTIEPADGVPAPTGAMVLLGQ